MNSAAYLHGFSRSLDPETQIRVDQKKLRCNPGNYQCGGVCIPKEHRCKDQASSEHQERRKQRAAAHRRWVATATVIKTATTIGLVVGVTGAIGWNLYAEQHNRQVEKDEQAVRREIEKDVDTFIDQRADLRSKARDWATENGYTDITEKEGWVWGFPPQSYLEVPIQSPAREFDQVQKAQDALSKKWSERTGENISFSSIPDTAHSRNRVSESTPRFEGWEEVFAKTPDQPIMPEPKTPVEQEVWKADREIRNLPYELAVIFDPNTGTRLMEVDGDQDSVSFSAEQLMQVRGTILTHNHPADSHPEGSATRAGVSFSLNDIIFAQDKRLVEMRAVGSKYVHILRPPIEGWQKLTQREWELSFHRNFGKAFVKSLEAISRQEYKAELANLELLHTQMQLMSQETGMIYHRLQHSDIESKRTDAEGQPCGRSHISAEKECHVGVKVALPPETVSSSNKSKPQKKPRKNGIPTAAYVAGTVGVAGLAGLALLGLAGASSSSSSGGIGSPPKQPLPSPPNMPTPSTPAELELAKADQEIRDLPHERAVIVDPVTGQRITEIDGEGAEVSFTPLQMSQLQNKTLTHNHPGAFYDSSSPAKLGTSFSPDDLYFAADNNLQEMRAVGRRYIHVIKPPPAGWASVSSKDMEISFEMIDQRLYRESSDRIARNQLEVGMAELEHMHNAMTALSQEFGFFYQRYQHADRADSVRGDRKKLKCGVSTHQCGNACVPKQKKCRASMNQAMPTSTLGVDAIISREEEVIRNQPIEHGVIIDSKTGKILAHRTGTATSVGFTYQEAEYIRGNVLTHNHPNVGNWKPPDPRAKGFSLSDTDVNTACTYQAKEVRAVSAGYTHSLKPPKQGWDRSFYEKKVQPAYNRHSDEVYNEMVNDIIAGRLAPEQAEVEYHHEVMRRTAKETGMTYTRTPVQTRKRDSGDTGAPGKACGRGHISARKQCRVGTGLAEPKQRTSTKSKKRSSTETQESTPKKKTRKASSAEKLFIAAQVALGGMIVAAALVGLTKLIMTAASAKTTRDYKAEAARAEQGFEETSRRYEQARADWRAANEQRQQGQQYQSPEYQSWKAANPEGSQSDWKQSSEYGTYAKRRYQEIKDEWKRRTGYQWEEPKRGYSGTGSGQGSGRQATQVPKNKTFTGRDWWEVLQVSPDATFEDVKAAYKRLARKFHPDLNKDPKAESLMKEVNEAFELGGQAKRDRHDSLDISQSVNLRLKRIIRSVYGAGVNSVMGVKLQHDRSIVGRFRDGRQVFDFTLSPEDKLSYVEAKNQDSYLIGYYLDAGLLRDVPPHEDAVSSSRKQCEKGKSCGLSCVARGVTCRVQLTRQAQAEAQAVRNELSSTQSPLKPRKSNNGAAVAISVGVVSGVSLLATAAFLGLNPKSGVAPQVQSNIDRVQKQLDEQVLKAAAIAYDRSNEVDIDGTIDKLTISDAMKQDLRKMTGAAKVFAAQVVFQKQGAKLISTDPKLNFSTFQKPDGSVMSVGSVGSKVITFSSGRVGNVGKYPMFGLGFRINNQYDRKPDQNTEQDRRESAQLLRIAKAAYAEQIKHLPENAFLRAEVWSKDGSGAKRESLYTKQGFRSLPIGGGYLWALKNEGVFTKIPDSQVEYISKLIQGSRGDRLDSRQYSKSYNSAFQAALCLI